MTESVSMAVAIDVEFDPETTTVDAIQRAAYRLSDRLALDMRTGETINCTIYPSAGEDATELIAAFRNEVLDQVLRERIRDETAAARNLILALAFSQTGTVGT